MKRLLLIGWGGTLTLFVFFIFYTGGRTSPKFAVPQSSQALIDNALSLGCTGGDFPSINYKNYIVESDCGGTNIGFCQSEQTAERIFEQGLYNWTIPDDYCGNTGQRMKPGCIDQNTGEFWGLFQYLEDQIEYMVGSPAVIEMLNGQLCGQGAHTGSETTVCGICDVCAIVDLCVFDANKGLNWNSSVYPCYDGSINYTDQYGNTQTWNTRADGWIIYANRGVVKLWPDAVAGQLNALIAIWGDSELPRIPPLPPVGLGYDSNTPGNVDANPGHKEPDRVCVEAQVRVPADISGTLCPVGDQYISQWMNIYADAVIIKTKLKIVTDPNNPNLVDLCPAFDPNTGGPSVDTTWLEVVDQDIEPDVTLPVVNCQCDIDNCFDPNMINDMLAGTVYDFLDELLHGNCPGNTSYCNAPPPNPPQQLCDGSWDNYYPCDNNNDGDNTKDADESLKLDGAPCDACDTPQEQQDNPQGGSTAGWDYCFRGVSPPSGTTTSGCSPGLVPMDLNNLLGGLAGNLPLSINDPEYSQSDPDYGTFSLFDVKYDVGCYLENPGVRSYGCYPQIGAALYPRWSEYNLCADVAEVGQYPDRTNPPPVDFIAPTAGIVYTSQVESYSWDAVDGTWTTANPGDVLTIPFSFTYYETPYTQIKVFRNGFASFDTTAVESPPPPNIPNPSAPNNLLAPFWQNWSITAETVSSYQLYEEGPLASFTSEADTYILRNSRTNPASGGEACCGYDGSSATCDCGACTIPGGTNDSTGGDIDTVGNITLGLTDYYYFDDLLSSTQLVDISTNGFLSFNNITPGSACSLSAPASIMALCADLIPTYDKAYLKDSECDACYPNQCDFNTGQGCCYACGKRAFGDGVVGFKKTATTFIAEWNGVVESCTGTTNCSAPSCIGLCTDSCLQGTNSTYCANSDPCNGSYYQWGSACANTNCGSSQNYAKVKLIDVAGGQDEIWFEFGDITVSSPARFYNLAGDRYVEFTPQSNYYYKFRRIAVSATAGSITYKNFGDRFVISWNNVHQIVGDQVLYADFQIVLYPNGEIVFRYQRANGTSGAVFGIENQDGSQGLPLSAPTSNSAVRIKPVQGYPYHFALGISQDLLTEVAYSLYVSSLACNVFDENSQLICGGLLGGDSGDCPAMKVSTHAAQFPGLKTADKDGYIEVRMRPAGSPSVRTGARNYYIEWPSGYAVPVTSGQYDGAMFVPHFLYEVRAPLDDGIPGVATNPKVNYLTFDTNGWAGLEVEYINQPHPLYPFDVGYIRAFLDIKFYLNEVRYSTESGIPPEEQRNAISNLLGLIGNAYLALLLDTRLQLPMLSPSGENPLTIKFLPGYVRPAVIGLEESSEAFDYLPGVWPENVTGDYWMIYGVLEGNIDPTKLMGLVSSMGVLSPPDEREYRAFLKKYPETFVSLDGWDGDGALPVRIKLDPLETKEWLKDGVLKVKVKGYDDDTPSSLLRFTTRLNRGVWTVPKGRTSVQLGNLPDGHYVLEIAAIDQHSRIDPTPAVVEFTIDNLPPRIVPIEEKTILYDDEYRLKLYVDDDLTPRKNLKARFRIDGGEFQDFDPVSGEVVARFPTVGLHEIYIEVYDEAGNRAVYNPAVFRNKPNKGLSCASVAKEIVHGGYKQIVNVIIAIGLVFLIPIAVLIVLRLKV